MNVEQKEIDAIKNELVPTWQSVAAVAHHAGIKPKRALRIIKFLRDNLKIVEMRDCRLDGHNPVWLVRPLDKTVKKEQPKDAQPYLSLSLEI